MREKRYAVSFAITLMWEEKSGAVRRARGRCLDLSPEGMRIETRERVDPGTTVLVASDQFGRMGHATVRYYRREMLNASVGLRFSTVYGLEDPGRRKILTTVLDPHRLATTD
jgi:hypothetical protein